MKGFLYNLLGILFFPLIVNAQYNNIDKAEYFIDTDPGVGYGNYIYVPEPAPGVDQTIDIPLYSFALQTETGNGGVGGFSPGFHTLFVRFGDQSGNWSLSEGRTFYITPDMPYSSRALSYAEYFFDTDPGLGKGQFLDYFESDTAIADLQISTEGLNPGYHTLFVRFQDFDGLWSFSEGRTFFISGPSSPSSSSISGAEYFFDTDPGTGKGIAISVPAPADTLNFNFTASTTGLSKGYHTLYVRTRDASNKWSLQEGRSFYIDDNSFTAAPSLKKAEYFFDQDPGVGKATSLPVTPGDSILSSASLALNGLKPGNHTLFIRFADANGRWGLSEGRAFTISGNTTSSPSIVSAEYFFDNDPGVGKGNAVPVSPADTVLISQGIQTTGLTAGNHNLYIRVKDAAGTWSLSERSSFIVCNAIPKPDFLIPNTICVTKPLVLKDSSSAVDAAATYKWDIDNNGTVDFTTKGDLSVTYPNTGTYTVKLKIDNGFGCMDSVTKTLTVNPNPVVTVTTNSPTTFCEGEQLSLYGQAGFAKYSWSNGDSTQNTIVKTSGTYKLQVIDKNGCSATSSGTVVSVKPAPLAYITAESDTVFCEGDSVKLNASYTSGASYMWSDGSTSGSTTVKTSGSYTVTVTAPGGCFRVSQPVNVVVNSLPDATIKSTSTSFCEGDSLLLTTGKGFRYMWSTGDTTETIYVKYPGNYSVIVVNGNNCMESSGQKLISVKSKPKLNYLFAVNGLTATFINQSFNTTTYSWDFGDGNQSNLVNPNNTYPAVDSYNVKLSGKNSFGCTDSIVKTVTLANVAVTGKVNNAAGKAALDSGMVILIRYNPLTNNYKQIDSVSFGQGGAFAFNNVTPGQYLLLAVANAKKYPLALPTYTGDTIEWKVAKVLDLVNNTSGISINVREIKVLTGPGFITGIVLKQDGSKNKTTGAGSPLKGILVSLIDNSNNKAIKYDVTDQTGTFKFEKIPYGNYRVYADLTGIPVDSVNFLNYYTITPTDSAYDDLTVWVDSTSITFEKKSATGISELNSLASWSIYPVPASDKFFVALENKNAETRITVSVSDLNGREVLSEETQIRNGHNVLRFGAGALNNGVYFIRLYGANRELILQRKLVVVH